MSKAYKVLRLVLFDKFMRAALHPNRVPQLIRYFNNDELTIQDIFEESENSDIIIDVLGDLSREEAQQIMRPFLSEAIGKAIGAKDVQVTWPK